MKSQQSNTVLPVAAAMTITIAIAVLTVISEGKKAVVRAILDVLLPVRGHAKGPPLPAGLGVEKFWWR